MHGGLRSRNSRLPSSRRAATSQLGAPRAVLERQVIVFALQLAPAKVRGNVRVSGTLIPSVVTRKCGSALSNDQLPRDQDPNPLPSNVGSGIVVSLSPPVSNSEQSGS